MTLENLYFDEAGNTGSNLLDPDQPVFVLASNCFDDDQAKSLISVVETKQAKEVKFQTLKKSEKGKKRIIEFFKQDLITPDYISTSIIHKGIMGVGQIAEILVEPYFDKQGLNFYDHYRNIVFTNRLWFCIDSFYGEDALKFVISNFMSMVKIKSKVSIDNFYEHIKYLCSLTNQGDHSDIFIELLASEPFVMDFLEHVGSENLDPVQSGIFTHSVHWGKKLDNGFNIIHDDSNTLEASLEKFNRFTNPNIIPRKIGNDERAFQIPLKTKSVNFEDSVKLDQLQISDLIASSTAYLAKSILTNSMDDFTSELLELDIYRFANTVVWPDKDCLERARISLRDNPLSSINPINLMVEALYTNPD